MAVTRINNNQITDASTGNAYVGINASTKVQDYSITAGKIANSLVYGSDLTVSGNLTVNGQTTTIDTVSTVIEDPVIVLASNQSGSPSVDIGFIGERGTSDNIAFVWDESADEFVTAFTTDLVTNTTVTISSYANFHTNDANVGGNLAVGGNISITGNVTSLNVTGNITGGNLLTPGVVTATGNITGGNLSAGSGIISTTGNINGANVSATSGITAGTTITATGNVTGGNVSAGSGIISTTGNINGGNLNATTGVSSTTVTATGNITGGNLTTSGITSTGSLTASTTIVATGNITGGNLSAGSGIISTTGNINGGNLNATTGVSSTTVTASGNVNGGNVISSALVSGTTVTASGNVNGGNVISTALVSGTTITATGNITGGNLSAGSGIISTTGNINGGNLNATTGVSSTTVTATGNITGGNLSAGSGIISTTGNINGANVNATSGITAGTTITATGNITGGNLSAGSGIISTTGNINGGNLNATTGVTTATVTASGNITGANVNATAGITAGTTVIATGNITGGNLTTSGLTQTGTLTTTGNAIVGGNLIVAGNISYTNVDDLRVEDPVIILGTGPNGAPLTTNDGMDRGVYMEYYTTGLGNAFMGWDNSTGNMIIASSVNFTGNNVVNVLAYGTLQAGNAYLQSAAVTGNVTGGNLITAGLVSAGTTITATGNITGGNLTTSGITSTGSLTASTTITATGNITGGNLSAGSGIISTTGNINGGNLNATTGVTTATVTASGNITGGNLTTSGITSTGSLTASTTINATGNITGGNLSAGSGIISTTGNINGGNLNATTGVRAVTGYFTGNVDVLGNLNATIGVVYANSGIFYGNSVTGNGAAFAGVPGFTSLGSNVVMQFAGNVNSYSQLNFENINNGTEASTDFIATADNGNDTTNFIDLGIGSSTYAPVAYPAYGANDGYLLNNGGNLLINSQTAGKVIKLIVGGSANGNIVMTVANTGVSVTGTVAATGNVSGGNVTTGGNVVATANVVGGNLTTAGLVSAGTTITATGNITGGNLSAGSGIISTTGNVNGGNVNATALVTGANVTATANVTGANVVGTTSGKFGNIVISGDNITDTNGRVNFNTAGADVDFAVNADTVANVFYVDAGTGTASFGSETQTTGALVAFNATNSVLMPVGNVGQRPVTGVTGMMRFNTTSDALEIYDNSQWTTVGVPSFTVIADDQFNGDGVTVAFTLSSSQTTNSCIVSINGVVQIPVTAYSVSGTTLTFTEAPETGDIIDVREITTTTTVTSISNGSGNAEVSVSDTTNDVSVTGDLVVSGSVSASSFIGLDASKISNGTSEMSVIASGGNIRANIAGATVQTISAGGVEITGNLTVTGNATLSGNILGDRIQNGTTTIDIQTVNGNANITVAGTSNVAVFSTAGANIAGTLGVTGNITGGNLSGTSIVGTLTTAAQTNITSVGTLGSLSVTGNITSGNTSGATLTASTAVSTPSIVHTGSNAVGNIGSSSSYFNTVFAQATSALYADLAEKYVADAEYAPGTVVVFGGDKEVTVSSTDADRAVAGVVSTNPSYIMNGGLEAEYVATVALTGRVPCRVTGTVRKGDLMVSAGYGLARAEADPKVGTVIGKALENYEGNEGVIEVVVGRF